MKQQHSLLDLEVEVEALLIRAEELRENIVEELPEVELYTLTGEVNLQKRWGAVLWQLNHLGATLRNLGF